MRTVRLAAVLSLLVASFAAIAQEQAPTPVVPAAAPSAEQIEQLIRQLGDEDFDRREAANKALATIGSRARAALEKGTKSDDAEIALRARLILEGLPKLTHTIVDALGQPIPLASVTLQFTRQPPSDLPLPPPMTSFSEEDGRIGVPELPKTEMPAPGIPAPPNNLRLIAIIVHDDYGMARVEVDPVDRAGGTTTLLLPLVKRGTEAYERALTGEVVAADGTPVGGATINCSDIRTPGEGLIEGRYPRGEAISGADGRFTYYLPPSQQRESERGVLTPANSRYQLQIAVPSDDSFFPWSGRYTNLQSARIELPRATRMHRFRFERPGGGFVTDPMALQNTRVQLDRMDKGERYLTDLGNAAVQAGRKLIPGTYQAESFLNGKRVQYLPLTVTADSPEELTFHLPHPVTYRGRVVGGTSGEPIAGAIVVGWSSTSRNNLALLTAEDWAMLKETPSNPPLDHPAITRLREFYGVHALVRTDAEGRFAITQQPDQEFYGVLAFAPDAVPFRASVGGLKPDEKHEVDVGEFPLYPAARVVVRPVFDGERLAVCPRWYPAADGQPEWFGKFKAIFDGPSSREFEFVHWLTMNEPQPVFVPAGLKLSLAFETPYDDKWDDALIDGLQLDTRESKNLGDVTFAANLPVTVRVVDRQGKPIEGVPVRQKYARDNAWSVAHNTDKEGLARFHFPRKTAGKFWVSDLPGTEEARSAANLYASFTLDEAAPAEPVATITLTDEQMELLLGKMR